MHPSARRLRWLLRGAGCLVVALAVLLVYVGTVPVDTVVGRVVGRLLPPPGRL